MNLIQSIEKGDKANIVLSSTVLAGVLYGIYKKKGLLLISLYGLGFGVGGAAINYVFKIK
jgi:hypothetical protein